MAGGVQLGGGVGSMDGGVRVGGYGWGNTGGGGAGEVVRVG